MRLPKYTDQSYPRALSPRLSPDHVAVMLGVVVAALAGLCGSLASVFAKLTVEHGDEMHGSRLLCRLLLSDPSLCTSLGSPAMAADPNYAMYEQADAASRAVFAALIVACNILMWGLFTWSMSLSKSTAHVTVVNSAANLFFTSVMGNVFFGEPLSMRWYLGASLLFSGVMLMNHAMRPRDGPKDAKDKDKAE